MDIKCEKPSRKLIVEDNKNVINSSINSKKDSDIAILSGWHCIDNVICGFKPSIYILLQAGQVWVKHHLG